MRRFLVALLALAVPLVGPSGPGSPAAQPAASPPRFCLVFVVDGLRPDSINPTDTPAIARLRDEGVEYLNSHAVFPTVTRVNAAALSTGMYPATNGLVSNDMYVPAVNPRAPFSTGDFRQLLKLEEVSGRILFAESLGEILHARGKRLVTLSSATTGSGLLLNPGAPRGVGITIHGSFDRGTLAAYPKEVNDVVLQRFGPPPAAATPESAHVEWTDNVLRDYVLPELRPDAVIDWLAAPDAAQHSDGVGSSQARDELKKSDGSIGRTLAKLGSLGLLSRTDVFVLSDHGFVHQNIGVDVIGAFVQSGLKRARDSTELVVASNGQSGLVHLEDRSRERTAAVVRFLQQQDWVDAIFTRGPDPVEGTFSLDLIHAANPARGADIVFSLSWGSDPNPFGVPGTQTIHSATRTGRLEGGGSGHGGLSPWAVRNTLIAWGAGVKSRTQVRAPAGLVDIAPTMLALLGIDAGVRFDGRVLREALRSGSGEPPSDARVLSTQAGPYRASIQLSRVGEQEYVDKAWRVR